jgi:aminoglycoside 3-N-acetyltransferase
MQRIRYLLLKYTPEFLLEAIRSQLKNIRRKRLLKEASEGKGLTTDYFINNFKDAGIREGDAVLVHSSLSKLGFVDGGAKTIVNALEDLVGASGTILMPAFPAEGRNLDYILTKPIFDVANTPSRMGSVSEYFRKLPGTFRSIHPTDSVCARGNDADWFTEGHKNMERPYAENSPFRRLCDRKGKILMLGTTLNGACTNLHTLEDAFDKFLYPVYMPNLYPVDVLDQHGQKLTVKTFVHNPEWSAKRNADALKPIFLRNQVLQEFKSGKAECMLIDAAKMLEVMKAKYLNNGVTMYTPSGGPLPQLA